MLDPFIFAGLKPGDVLTVKFGNEERAAIVMDTYVTNENVPPSHVRVSIDDHEYLVPDHRVLRYRADAFTFDTLPKP